MSTLPDTELQFEESREKITTLHQNGASGARVALALTKRLDNLLSRVFENLRHSDRALVSVVALGAYGRQELCFASDVDIMVLVAEQADRARASSLMQEYLHRLLDVGLDIGHSFRTVDECVEFASGDFESWVSMLETRPVCGNRAVYRSLLSAVQASLKKSDSSVFVQKLASLFELRHAKYGNSIKLLEPNIKNSAGGLRDAHTVLWMLRGTGSERISSNAVPMTTSLFASRVLQALFSKKNLQGARKAFDFLLRTRNEMHLQANAIHDTLEFTFQRQVAEGLGFRKTKDRTSVERFMQEYYNAARTLAQVSRRVIAWANEQWVHAPSTLPQRRLSDHFVLKANKIHTLQRRGKLTNQDALQALQFSADYNAVVSHQVEDAVQRSISSFTPLKTDREASLFRTLMNKPSGIGETFRQMNSLGVLARWIPEWKPMVAFFQHNQYHYYTADEHTLAVISNTEALGASKSSFGEVFRSLPRKDTLYLACFLHDIAKPIRIGNHEVTGVRVSQKILRRLRYDDILDDVSFLVRHHLIMEQVAFRRNLNDPQTIVDFAKIFRNRTQLDLLYVLTYADLSAVNKHVWTEWKEMLLFDLYKKTRAALDSQLSSEQIHRRSAEQSGAAAAAVSQKLSHTFSEKETGSHSSLIENPSYLTAFTVDEIGEQLRTLRRHENVSLIFNHWSDFTEITVIAADAPFALSRFCGVLSANDANIFDAHVFTRNDGIIVDKFRVVDFISKSVLTEAQCKKIRADMADVLAGTTDIVHLMQRHRMKWKRRSGAPNPNIRVDVEFEDHPRYTILDVFAFDALGFLYKVTETISRLGLNISFAKIATRVDGIVDTFYVTDTNGRRVDDAAMRDIIKSQILKTVQELSTSELATTP